MICLSCHAPNDLTLGYVDVDKNEIADHSWKLDSTGKIKS